MNERQRRIIETACEAFMRHGVRRTTMSELATAAGVSRPTLYGFFASKEDLLGGTIEYFNEVTIETIEKELKTCSDLSEELDVFFRNAVVKVFELMQVWPDASDVVSEENQVAKAAYESGLKDLEEVIGRILLPYRTPIERKGISLSQYASFVVATASRLKKNIDSKDRLEGLLASFKVSILSVAGEL